MRFYLLYGVHTEREESVKEFVSRNLGEEVYYRLIDPFCSGVYAGDPSKLSMKAAFGRVGVTPPAMHLGSLCLQALGVCTCFLSFSVELVMPLLHAAQARPEHS